MNAFDFICSLPHPPMMMHGNKPCRPSKSEIKRWLQNQSVLINSKKPAPQDEIEFPIEQLIFFPKNEKSRCTMIDFTDHRSFWKPRTRPLETV